MKKKLAAIIGDLHAGVRDGNSLMTEYQLNYLTEVFIPYLIEHGIDTVIQTGDIFDIRKHTNTAVLAEWKEKFFQALEDADIHLIVYVGNHDAFYKNTLKPNSVREHLSQFNNIRIIEEPEHLHFGDHKCLMVPWICRDNEERAMDLIRNSDATVCFGHFEIKGAKMEGATCTDGLPLSTFARFDKVFSGHFHIKGNYENVLYVGTPYQMTWGDYGIDKGFWVWDTETMKTEFIKSDRELYHRITYNEDRDMDAILMGNDFRDKHVKVIIEHRENFAKYEKWLMTLEVTGAASLVVVEPFSDRDSDDSEIDFSGELNVLSTTDLIKDYVVDVYPEKQEPLTKMMVGLHNTARSIHG